MHIIDHATTFAPSSHIYSPYVDSESRIIQVSKNKPPGDSCFRHRCGCSPLEHILKGCSKCCDTDPFPFLDIEALAEGEVKRLKNRLVQEGDEMTMQFDDFRREFASIIKKVDLVSLKTAMTGITSSKCFKRSIRAMHDRKKEIRNAKNYVDLLDIIENYVTWFNCTLLDTIALQCVKLKSLKTKDYGTFCKHLKQYEEARMSYCKRGIFECPFSLFSKNKSQMQNTRLFCLLVDDDKIQDFEHLDVFEGNLASIIEIERFNLVICSIGKGCIELVYLLPSCVHELLFPLNTKQLQGLAMIGVTEISIGTSYESINTLLRNEHGTLSLNTSSDNSGELNHVHMFTVFSRLAFTALLINSA